MRLRAHRGRRKTLEKVGVLENTYPSIFTVRVDEPIIISVYLFICRCVNRNGKLTLMTNKQCYFSENTALRAVFLLPARVCVSEKTNRYFAEKTIDMRKTTQIRISCSRAYN